jgi:hypothetical protein
MPTLRVEVFWDEQNETSAVSHQMVACHVTLARIVSEKQPLEHYVPWAAYPRDPQPSLASQATAVPESSTRNSRCRMDND